MKTFVILTAVPYDGMKQRPQHFVDHFSRQGHKTIYIDIHRTLQVENCPGSLENVMQRFYSGSPVSAPFARTLGPNLLVYDRIPVCTNKRDSIEYVLELIQLGPEANDLIFIITFPDWVDYVHKLDARTMLIYDCLDDWAEFVEDLDIGMSSTTISKERKLAMIADLVIVSAKKLFAKMSCYNDNVFYLPNGVVITDYAETVALPREYESIPKPIIFFMGALHGWVDVNLIEHAARKRQHYSFVIVGPVADKSNQPCNPNIHYLGQKPYSQLASYLKHSRVAIIPFKVNKLTVSVTPLKFFEYLAAGVPVVTTVMPDLAGVPGSTMTSDYDQFLCAIDDYVNMEPQSYERETAKVLDSVQKYDWSNLLDGLCNRIFSNSTSQGRSFLEKTYEEYCSISPHPVIENEIMTLAVRLGKYDEAIEVGERLIGGDCGVDYASLALAYFHTDNAYRGAETLAMKVGRGSDRWYANYLELLSDEPRSKELLQVLALRLSDQQLKALELLDQTLVSGKCSEAVVFGMFASLLIEVHELDFAMAAIEKVVECASGNIIPYVDPVSIGETIDCLNESKRYHEAETLALELASYGLPELSYEKLGTTYLEAFLNDGESEVLG